MLAEKPELDHLAGALDRIYDPVKAHQYYLRTRKLKGRKKGRAEPSTGAGRLVKTALASPASKKPVGNNPQLQRQRQQAAARVSTLREKLSELNARLKEKMAEAREAEAKEKKGPSSSEKREAAERSKDWRAKNQQKVKQQEQRRAAKEKDQPETKKSGGGDDSIEGIRTAITKVKAALDKAVARQRALG
jgi:hypothetical protein